MSIDLDRIRLIATELRTQLVREKTLEQWGEPLPVSDLACWCAIASHALTNLLRGEGLEATFVRGVFHYGTNGWKAWGDHCWVQVGPWIVDITAQQFGKYAPVLITQSPDPRFEATMIDEDAYNEIRKEWPMDQIPPGILVQSHPTAP